MATTHPLTRPSARRLNQKRTRRGSVLGWLFLLAFVGIAAVGGWYYKNNNESKDKINVLTHTVQRGNYALEVVEQGEVESASNVEVRCEVKAGGSSGTTILEVIAEGTNVKPGELLCKLDASPFETELVQQQIACNSSEATMIEATNSWEAAKIARKEYVEGTFYQEEQTIQSEIFIAEENLRRAKEYVNYSKRLAARGYVTSQQLEGDQFAVEIAKTDLDAAKTKLRVLREYTKPKMLKQLDSDIKSAEAQKKSGESSYKLELSKLKDIESQIEKCTIKAPSAGQVVHANKQSSRGGSEFIVEAGAMVRENQAIIRLPDPDEMQVETKINESRVTMVRPGMPATIRLDAYDDQLLKGEVTRVNEYPEPSSFWSSQVKEYSTFVKIIDSPIKIRPGLTAEVTIVADSQTDVLLVPVQALHEHGHKFYCIERSGQEWELQEVQLVSTNDKFAIVEGLDEGAVVAMSPRKLLDQIELPEIVEEAPPEVPEGVRQSKGPPAAKGSRSDGPSRGDRGGGRPGGRSESGKPAGSGGGRPSGGAPGGGGAGGGGRNAGAIAGMIMGRMDKNKDGKISKDEIPADQQARMAESDQNGDGNIEKSELEQSISKRMKSGGGGTRGGPQGGK